VWRARIIEIKKQKGISSKMLSERSGIPVDTIQRILNAKTDVKDVPRLNTLIDICNALEIDVWRLFYTGDDRFLELTNELEYLRKERDELIADNATKQAQVTFLTNKVDELKDKLIETHEFYVMKEKAEKK
jgi:transcriptional regulator with XRE-family HTH domain